MVNPIFYRSIAPLNREQHRDLTIIDDAARFGFARDTHMIPAVIDEFTTAHSFLPIVFAPATPYPTTVFLVGLRPSQNLLVDAGDKWASDYVPAYLRRYPFIQGDMNERAPITCIDEQSDLIDAKNGKRLFDEAGNETDILKYYIEFMVQYYHSAQRTDTFIKAINDLSLLRQVTIESKFNDENSAILHGFLTVDEDKLNALPADSFLKLRDQGFLPIIYAHLFSLRSVDVLRRIVNERTGQGKTKEKEKEKEKQVK